MLSPVDCCGLFNFITRLTLPEEKIDKYEAKERLLTESREWHLAKKSYLSRLLHEDAGDAFWASLTQRPFPINKQLQNSLPKFKKEGLKSQTVVYLGCGNSESTIYLLERKWNVIAIDNSQGALENLLQRTNQLNPNWIQNGQLKLVCQNMETYCFPKNVQIVLADNSLMHCDPMKIRDLFKSIYASLSKGGRIIGNFYPAPKDQKIERLFREVFQVWLTDKAMVDFLLEDTGFQTEVCAYNTYCFISDPTTIEFVGLKG